MDRRQQATAGASSLMVIAAFAIFMMAAPEPAGAACGLNKCEDDQGGCYSTGACLRADCASGSGYICNQGSWSPGCETCWE
jgi:hypothetical protein